MKQFFSIFFAPFAVLTAFLIFTFAGGFNVWPWFDNVFHFTGGISVAVSASMILNVWDKSRSLNVWPSIFVIVSMAIFAAVAWEVMEFILDYTTGSVHQPSNFDTMKDLILGTLGATIFALIYKLKY